jgi:hypothetical protein
MDNIRYIVIYFDAHHLDSEKLKNRPGAEIYCVKPASLNSYNEIDMALLNDLHCPVRLVFVGGELAKEAAEKYWSTWIPNTPTATEDVLSFWDAPCDAPWNLPTGSGLVQFGICSKD